MIRSGSFVEQSLADRLCLATIKLFAILCFSCLASFDAAYAFRATAEPFVTYNLYGSSHEYASLEELITNWERRDEQYFARCMDKRGADYGECAKHTIVSQAPASWNTGYTNGEPNVWGLSLDRYYDHRYWSGHDTGTEPSGSIAAVVQWSCPNGFASVSEGPSEARTVRCEQVVPESCGVGNPIDAFSGIKYESSVDYESANGLLQVTRFYIDQYSGWLLNSEYRLKPVASGEEVGTAGLFGDFGPLSCVSPTFFDWSKYRATYDDPGGSTHYTIARCARLSNAKEVPVIYVWVDGKQQRFVATGDVFLPEGDLAAHSKIERMPETTDTGAAWRLSNGNGLLMYFDAAGRLLRKAFSDGTYVQLHYSGNRLISKTDSSGRSLTYEYDDSGRLTAVVTPGGDVIEYGYVSDDSLNLKQYWLLERVGWADGSSISYVYREDNHGAKGELYLTGKFDSYRNRVGTYTYSGSKAQATEGFEGEGKKEVAYRSHNTVRLKDGLGSERTLYFNEQLEDGRRLLTQVNQPAGSGCNAARRFNAYNDQGQVTERRDYNGNRTQYAYDPVNHYPIAVVENIPSNSSGLFTAEGVTLPAGATKTSTEWNSMLHKAVSVASPGTLTSIIYNGYSDPFNNNQPANCSSATLDGLPLPVVCRIVEQATTDLNGSRGFSAAVAHDYDARDTHYTYDSHGRLLTVSRSLDGEPELTLEYYPDSTATHRVGDLKLIRNRLGHEIRYEAYDAHGHPTAVTDTNGITYHYSYDERGRLTSETAAGQTTTLTYDLNGKLTAITSPGGNETRRTYDGAGRLESILDNSFNRLSYRYDLEGNVLATTALDAAGTLRYTSQYQYDALSRLEKTTDSVGNTTTYFYDAVGNLTSVKDAKERTASNQFNAANRVTTATDPLDDQVNYTYDARGNIVQVKDQQGLTTTYTYDAFDNLASVTSPDTGTTTYTYDAAGNRTSATDSRGVVTEYTYDALNRLTQVVYPDSPGENITYTYDDTTNGNLGIGRLTGIRDASGETSYRYNYLGLVTEKRASIGGVTAVVSYEYDSAGQLTQLTYPSGRIVTYERDSQGRIAGVATQSGSQATSVLLDDIQYLPFGPATYYTYGNGLSHDLEYDLDYRLTRINVEGIDPILERTYSYDPVNNITGIASGLNSQKSQLFDYDALDRLIQAEGFYGLINYTYDGVGNRLSRTLDDGSITQETYRYASDSHRLLGVEQTTDGAPGQNRGFTYDAAGNPITRTGEAGEEQVFTYNAANRMAEVAVDQSAAASYTYNALGQRVKKVLANGPAELMLYGEQGQLLAVTDGAGNTLREYIYFNNQQIAFIDYGINASGQLYYIHNDHLGTPQVATDANQQVVWMADYQPFGKLLPNNQNSTELFSRFPGQYEDAETGLYYNYFRDYDPSLGRYLQSDPIGLNGGINTYTYIDGNPLSFIDPLGLAWTPGQAGMTYGAEWNALNGLNDRCLSEQEIDAFASQMAGMVAGMPGGLPGMIIGAAAGTGLSYIPSETNAQDAMASSVMNNALDPGSNGSHLAGAAAEAALLGILPEGDPTGRKAVAGATVGGAIAGGPGYAAGAAAPWVEKLVKDMLYEQNKEACSCQK